VKTTAPITAVASARNLESRDVQELAREVRLPSAERSVLRENGLCRIPVARGSVAHIVADVLGQLLADPALRRDCSTAIFTHSLEIASSTRHQLDMLLRAELPSLARPPIFLAGRPCSVLHLGLELGAQLGDRGAPVIVLGADVAPTHDDRFFFGSVMGDAAVGVVIGGPPRFGELLAVRSETHVLAADGTASSPDDIARFRAENPTAIRAVLEQSLHDGDCGWSDLAAIVPHTPYGLIWDTVATVCRYPREQILDGRRSETGHLNSNDVLHHLLSATDAGDVTPGNVVALLSPGFGGTRGCTLLRYSPASP
jgi:3-oxoacyl-[acyl-carrier-protein] synthase-3